MPFLLPMIVLSTVFFVTPLVLLAFISFTNSDGFGTLQNYAQFLADDFSVSVLLDTLRLGAFAVAGTTIIGVPIVLLHWHSGRRMRHLLVIFVLLPMLTSNVVRTFAWIVILGREGLINRSLLFFGISNEAPLLFTEAGLVMALCQTELPLFILPVLAVMTRINRELIDAAEVSGAGQWRIFATILLPLALPGVLAGWVLVFASATTSYVTQVAIGGARHIYLPQLIYREVGILFDWPFAAALSLMLLLVTGSVIFALAMLSRHRRLTGHA